MMTRSSGISERGFKMNEGFPENNEFSLTKLVSKIWRGDFFKIPNYREERGRAPNLKERAWTAVLMTANVALFLITALLVIPAVISVIALAIIFSPVIIPYLIYKSVSEIKPQTDSRIF